MTHLGRMLRLYRAAHSVEQQALAERIGVDPRHLGRAELDVADSQTMTKINVWLLEDDELPISRQAPVPLMGGKQVSA